MAAKNMEVFLLPDGSLYHLGVRAGDLAPRILTVGERARAKLVANELLDDCKEFEKSRNFLTITGKYKGVTVSVVSIGMGMSNMDFLVREASYLFQDENMAFVRLGTCGIFNPNYQPGTLFISDRLFYCYRNYVHFDGDPLDGQCGKNPYLIAGPVPGDKDLTDLVEKAVKEQNLPYCRGQGVSSETFYGCQGRLLPGFEDECGHVLEKFEKLKIDSCEMESHMLFHLCKERTTKSKPQRITRAASICLGVVSRVQSSDSGPVHTASKAATDKVIVGGAKAALEALIAISL